MARCPCPWDGPESQRENLVPVAQGRLVQAWNPLATKVPFFQFASALSPGAMQRGDERSDCTLPPPARNGLRSATRSNAPPLSCTGRTGGVFPFSKTGGDLNEALDQRRFRAVRTSLVHRPGRDPGSGQRGQPFVHFPYIAPFGQKRGLPEPPRTLAVTGSGRQDSNLRPSAPKAPALPSCATPRLQHSSP